MFGSLAKSLFGSDNDRAVKKFAPQVAAIIALEKAFARHCDEEFRSSFAALASAVAHGRFFDTLLAQAFARVRDAEKRALGRRA